MEDFKKRLKRFVDQDELEILGWMMISMQNYILPELYVAQKNRLANLIFLGTHSIIQTIAEGLFGLKGLDATRFYLQNFVDGNSRDTQFSLISDEIHEIRNVMAHQWWSSSTHAIGLDFDMGEGWRRDPDLLHINPGIYAAQFARAFEGGEFIDKYQQLLTAEQRVVRKYLSIRRWLRLGNSDPIAQEIRNLERCASMQDVRAQESVIRQMIYHAYGL